MGAIALVIGVIGFGAVIAAVVAFVVIRSRRTSSNGGPYPQNVGYSPQQPTYAPAQQPYPTSPNQGYGYPAPAPAVQPPQHPNPYAQQPPSHGQ